MANNSEVESNLILRARDLSTETIKQVASEVDKLTTVLKNQSDAAIKGEGSMKGLSNALRDSDQILANLLKKQGQLDGFAASMQKMQDAEAARDKAIAARDAAKNNLPDKKSDRTDEQSAQFAALQRAVNATEAAFKRSITSYNNASNTLKILGISAKEVTSSQAEVAAAILRTSTAIGSAEKVQINYNKYLADANKLRAENVKAENDAAKAVADAASKKAAAENALVAAAAKRQADRQRDADALVAMEKARAENFVQYQAKEAKAADDYTRLKNQYRVAEMDQADKQTAKDKADSDMRIAQANKEAAELAKLQNLAFESMRNTQRTQIGQGTSSLQSSPNADAVSAIINPANTARSTLSGLEKEVTSLNAALGQTKVTAETAREGLNNMSAAANGLKAQAALIDQFKAQQAATQAAATAADKAGEKLADLGFKTMKAATATKDMDAAVKTAISDVKSATAEYESQNNKLTTLHEKLAAAGIDYKNLDGAMVKIIATSKDLTANVAKAQEVLSKDTGHGGAGGAIGSFLGIRPDQALNVAHEVNHAFDMIVAGGSPVRAVLEQAGKVAFNFQDQLAKLAPYALRFAAALPFVAIAIAGVIHALENESAARGFNARLLATNDGLTVTAKEMTNLARELQKLGMSFDDAKKSIEAMLKAGVHPEMFAQIGKLGQEIADVYGIKIPEAVEKMAHGMRGGLEAIVELDKEFHVLTPSLYDNIKASIEAGDANKAHTTYLDALSARMEVASKDAVNPLTKAVRELKAAWNDFLTTVGNVLPLQSALGLLRSLLGVMNGIANISAQAGAAVGVRGPLVAATAQGQVDAQQERVNKLLASNPTGFGVELLKQEQAKLAVLKQQATVLGEITAQQGKNAQFGKDGAAQNNREAEALHRVAVEMRETREGRFDPTLRDPAQIRKQDEEYIKAVEAKLRRDAVTRADGANIPAGSEVDSEIKAQVARVQAERENQRRRTLIRQEDSEDPLKRLRDNAEDAARKGNTPENRERDRIKNEDQVQRGIDQLWLRYGGNRVDIEKRFEGEAEAARKSLNDKSLREREAQGAKGGERRLNAEEGLEKQLLALREKIDGLDKTNLEARLRGIDEEYARYDILIAKAQRAGVNSVGGKSIAEFKAEIDSLKDEAKAAAGLATYEAAVNKLVAERKTAYEANNRAVEEGRKSIPAGYAEALRISKELTPAIQELAKKAADFARELGGANPTPKVRAAIAQFDAVANDPETNKQGVSGNIQAGLTQAENLAKTRDQVVQANRKLQSEHLQSSDETEANAAAAYERTTAKIKLQTAQILAAAKAARQLGIDTKGAQGISEDSYQLVVAKVKELNSESTYLSANMQELYKTIESSIGNHAVQAFDQIGQAIGRVVAGQGKFKDIVSATAGAFANMVASILKDIAALIIKQLVLAGVSAIVAYLTGGASTAGGASAVSAAATTASSVVSGVSASVKHDGGMIGAGQSGMNRQVNPDWFANAPRFHTGGIVGLQPDEHAAILQTGEEVLKKGDARNMLNGGGKPEVTSKPAPIRQVLVMNPADISSALAGSHGEEVVITHIKNNAGAIKTLLQ